VIIDDVSQRPGFWSLTGPKSDIVLSCRVRLARNIHGLPFPGTLGDKESYMIRHSLERFASESRFSGNTKIIDIDRLDIHEKRFLRERNLITSEMESSSASMVLLDNDDDYAILVNDEDHFRIQVIKAGLQLDDALRLANEVDDELNRYAIYAFSETFGYLTACPSNLGTGMRCSLLLHLPALSYRNRLSELVPALKERGIEFRGTVGENRKTIGSIFQISNRFSLGVSESEIAETLDSVVHGLIAREDNERDEAVLTGRNKLEDRVFRSLGILRYARSIAYSEAMEHLSNVRFGIILAFIKNMETSLINDIMVNIQWSHLQNYYRDAIVSNSQCDRLRAEYINQTLRATGCC
jgi:protein arginine kinase